ncbi:MAG: SIR2 family protein, partial [Candidatus Brocadiia bacterium]
YGRARLVERVSQALLVSEAQPGAAHKAFCQIYFSIVCTTNVDFLLEKQYSAIPSQCRPIIDEDGLSINDEGSAVVLLKLHGDLHHPARLVLTEEDYDAFLQRYPLLATFLANLLITRTAVLIGYSLNDPDFRQVWKVIGERLGEARRHAYAILVDAKQPDIARFARRGVKAINLPGNRADYAKILASAFGELGEYMALHLIGSSHVTEENSLAEFSLPPKAITRLCYFAVPLDMLPQYRDQVFPLAEKAGLVPVTAVDVIAPGGNYSAKIDAIMRRCVAAVVDVKTPNTRSEAMMLMGLMKRTSLLLVAEEGTGFPSGIEGVSMLDRSNAPLANQSEFLTGLGQWFNGFAKGIRGSLVEEPARLLDAGEYRAAVISAMTYLESFLRAVLEKSERPEDGVLTLVRLLKWAMDERILLAEEYRNVLGWAQERNKVVHSQESISRQKAAAIVNGVKAIAARHGKSV